MELPGGGAHAGWTLPAGRISIAVRQCGTPVCVDGNVHGIAVVGGPRVGAYHKPGRSPVRTVGVEIEAWAASALLGHPGVALRGAHVSFEDLWGAAGRALADRVREQGLPALVQWLHARGARSEVEPWVRLAVQAFRDGANRSMVARQTGYSQRHISARVLQETGLSPREHRRLARLERLLALRAKQPQLGWAGVASAVGFTDQAHMCREVKALTGFTPGRLRGRHPRHVAASSQSSKTGVRPACHRAPLQR